MRCPPTRPTSCTGRWPRRSTRSAWPHRVSGSPATTGCRTPAGSARRRRRSSAGSCSRGRWSTAAKERFDDVAVLDLADRIEGHPDNVAPALLGGFTIAYPGGGPRHGGSARGRPRRRSRWRSCRPTRWRPRWPAGCCPTPYRTRTRRPTPAARRCSSRRSPAAPSCCWPRPTTGCTRTTDARRCRDSLALVDVLRADGVAAVVSGAGPTVLALAPVADVPELVRRTPPGWTGLTPGVSRTGALQLRG